MEQPKKNKQGAQDRPPLVVATPEPHTNPVGKVIPEPPHQEGAKTMTKMRKAGKMNRYGC